MLSLVLLGALGFLSYWLLVSKYREDEPQGPRFRVPMLGHAFHLFKGQIEGYRKLRKM